MRRTWTTAMVAAALAPTALTACGDEKDAATAATRPGAASPSPAPRAEVPVELAGTWKATIRYWELADPPDDLPRRRSAWTLEFLGTGGIDNGPSMFLATRRLGEFVNPITVAGDQITLQIPADCQVYFYAVAAEQLTLTSAEDGCPRTSLSSVLTARPWRRTAR